MTTTPRFPSTLAPPSYYLGLAERFSRSVLPTLAPYLSPPPHESPPQRGDAASTLFRGLELASGDGTQVVLYAQLFDSDPDNCEWQPTECDEFGCRAVDETVRRQGGTKRVRTAVRVDVMEDEGWQALRQRLDDDGRRTDANPGGKAPAYDVVVICNTLHMLPFPEGPQRIFKSLLTYALVRPEAKLLFYGPFRNDEGFFSESDKAFDQEISTRPSPYPLGLRSIDALSRLAASCGWTLAERIGGVATGNWVLVFEQQQQQQVSVRGSDEGSRTEAV